MADGLVYSNLGKKPLGSISKDSIDDIVRTELQNSKSWFKLRNNIKSCKVCLFKNFCPPLSNIEKVMKKNDLCLINKKE
jgi:pseudo-rSAM protein